MAEQNSQERTSEIITNARLYAQRDVPAAKSKQQLKTEIYRRRQLYLGSDVSLRDILADGGDVSNESIEAFSGYMADRTVLFWRHNDEQARNFCYEFYRISLHALLSGMVRECVDDLIRLSGVLIRARRAYSTTVMCYLPADMVVDVLKFLDSGKESYLSVHFEDAVLYAVASLLGALNQTGSLSAERRMVGLWEEMS